MGSGACGAAYLYHRVLIIFDPIRCKRLNLEARHRTAEEEGLHGGYKGDIPG
jgi:hypothetical protein